MEDKQSEIIPKFKPTPFDIFDGIFGATDENGTPAENLSDKDDGNSDDAIDEDAED